MARLGEMSLFGAESAETTQVARRNEAKLARNRRTFDAISAQEWRKTHAIPRHVTASAF